MARATQPTVMEVLVRRAGWYAAFRASSFLVAWMIAEDDLGPTMSVEEYGEWWGQSRATAYRDLERWRRVVPEYGTPSALVAELGSRDLGARAPDWLVAGAS
jgi:hypothetical protein